MRRRLKIVSLLAVLALASIAAVSAGAFSQAETKEAKAGVTLRSGAIWYGCDYSRSDIYGSQLYNCTHSVMGGINRVCLYIAPYTTKAVYRNSGWC